MMTENQVHHQARIVRRLLTFFRLPLQAIR